MPLADIKLLILDVDGVLTDGTVMFGIGGVDGEEVKAFSTRDGAGIALWRDAGFATTFLTGRGGAAVQRRARELRIERIWEHVHDKVAILDEICAHYSVTRDEVAGMGDDIVDLRWLGAVGYSAAPADAARDVLERVDLVTPSNGGHGAVRDLVEHLLRETGRWDAYVERFC